MNTAARRLTGVPGSLDKTMRASSGRRDDRAAAACMEALEGRTLFAVTAPFNDVTQWNAASISKTNTWQYDYSATLGGTATPFPVHASHATSPKFDFWGQSAVPFTTALVGRNTSGGTATVQGAPGDPNAIIWPANELAMGFGNAGAKDQYSIIRWVAPSAGTFNITGKFTDLQKSKVVLDVLHNGKAAFASSYSGNSGHQGDRPFSLANVKIAKGDTIDFVAGPTGFNYDCVVGVAATISVSPPSDSIVASDPRASIPALGPVTTGSFTIKRSALSAASTISASLGGTAIYKTDYNLQVYGATGFSYNATTRLLTINAAAGSGPIVIEVIPIAHASPKASATVILTLKAGAYAPVAAQTSATVTITA